MFELEGVDLSLRIHSERLLRGFAARGTGAPWSSCNSPHCKETMFDLPSDLDI